MNKALYIAAVLAIGALCACTKTDIAPAPGRAVSFVVAGYAPVTRAEASIITEDGITAFSSRAFMHSSEAPAVPGYINFFPGTGEAISWNGTEWTPGVDYFWPRSESSYINFISWAGGSPEISYSKDSGSWKAGFRWSGEVAPDANWLWADMAWRYSGNAHTYYKDSESVSGVPTLFHHALARLSFKARASKLAEPDAFSPTRVEWTVAVRSLSMSGFKNSGMLSLSNTDPGDNRPAAWQLEDGGWTGLGGDASCTRSFDSPLTLGASEEVLRFKSGVTELDWYSVIPQGTSGVKLSMDWTVTTTYYSAGSAIKTIAEDVTTTADLFADTAADASWDKNWGMNQIITYSLVLDPDAKIIRIIPDTADWGLASDIITIE